MTAHSYKLLEKLNYYGYIFVSIFAVILYKYVDEKLQFVLVYFLSLGVVTLLADYLRISEMDRKLGLFHSKLFSVRIKIPASLRKFFFNDIPKDGKRLITIILQILLYIITLFYLVSICLFFANLSCSTKFISKSGFISWSQTLLVIHIIYTGYIRIIQLCLSYKEQPISSLFKKKNRNSKTAQNSTKNDIENKD